ncbi:DB module domain-containing protein [Ditylenchus destructor]|nr:DB module domain-containing protein [Ditylenchus destructor]
MLSSLLTPTTANGESPDGCCRRHGVPEVCVQTLCYPSRPPGDFDVYDVFERKQNNCSKHLKSIAHCLADGRDHSTCCAREAKDRDEAACFALCRGDGRHSQHMHSTDWTQYQTCLAINLPSMFNCFEKGYQTNPTPPQNLLITSIEAHVAHIAWSTPETNTHLVENYVIVASQLDEDGHEVEEQTTQVDNTNAQLEGLEPGTSYVVRVTAQAGDGRRSLPSLEVQFQTKGVAPRVQAFKPKISVAKTAQSALLACRFQISGVSEKASHLHIEWQHRSTSSGEDPEDDVSGYTIVSGFRFNQTYYLYSESKPREHLTTLEIYDLDATTDFGQYRCVVTDEFGQGQASVSLRLAELNKPASSPPPSPLACCQRRGIETRCLPMCGATDTGEVPVASTSGATAPSRRYVPRPYMPSNCSGEISKVLSCAMPEVDDSGCCLRERVPKQCMYLCDSSVEPANQMSATCLDHVNAVEQCRISGVEKRPSAVQGLKVQNAGSATVANTALISWEPSNNAEIYHVYWRRRGSDQVSGSEEGWEEKSQVLTTRKVHNADEIVVVAANSYGISQPAKLVLSANDYCNLFRIRFDLSVSILPKICLNSLPVISD